jgi:hypothetical protein
MSTSQSGVRNVFGGILVLVLLVVVAKMGWSMIPTASNQGYAPEQPIPFNHKKHAGLYKMDCKYCHVGPDKARHSTVPALNVCMNCHTVVKTDSPLIQTLTKHYKEGTPVEWVRIYEVPDFVQFNHKRHVKSGLVCQDCHGPVQEMERVYQYAPLTMGWCMDCHRGVTAPKRVLNRTNINENLPPGHVAPVNCSTCHY